MKKNIFLTLSLFCFIQPTEVGAWNALGHQLVAEIAYEHLTRPAKKKCNQYNSALNHHHKRLSFVNAAVWLDTLYDKRFQSLKPMHYIDIPFSDEILPLPPTAAMNALVAIRESQAVLLDPNASLLQKGMALRILLHVVGDIHQPLHAATRVSSRFPMGDKGGNLFRLGKNPIANNLHGFWDKGGGFLSKKRHYKQKDIKLLALEIERQYPCHPEQDFFNPLHWATESHNLAVTMAYKTTAFNPPSLEYQQAVEAVAKKQIAIAGCRLAGLLNELN